MATPRDKYYTKMLETIVDYNDDQNAPFSNDKRQKAISTVMAETEEEECNIITDANNVTMDTFYQSPVTTNTQGKNSNAIFTSERRNTLDTLTEALKVLTLDSTINNYAYKSDPLVATHTSDEKKGKFSDTDTTNVNYPQRLLINRTLPMIIPPIDPRIADGVTAGRGTEHARQTIASKVIVTAVVRSGAHVLQNPADVIRTDTDETIPRDGNTSISYPRFSYTVLIGGGTTVSPTRTGSQEIISPKGPTSSVEVRNAQPFHTSINGNYAKDGDSTPTVIGRELSNDSSANIYLRCRVNFTCESVVTKTPNFMNLRLLAVQTSDGLG